MKSKKKVKRRMKKPLKIIIVVMAILFIILGILLILVLGGVLNIFSPIPPKQYKFSEIAMVGDYVDYKAGNYEEDKALPNRGTAFTLGGYKKGESLDKSVYCGQNEIDNSGWRIFSMDDDNVTLIHAGIPMCYYHGYGSGTNDKSVSILSGKDEKINFDMFLDKNGFGESVRILSKEDVDTFNKNKADYQLIKNDLISIGTPYWLNGKNGTYFMWYVTEGGMVATDHVGSYGVRVLVTLNKNARTTGQNKKGVWNLVKEEVKEK